MEPRTYYITNTKGNSQFSKIMIYLDGNSIKFTDHTNGRKVCRCMLDIYSLKLNYTNNTGEIDRNQKMVITIDSNNLNGYWR